jgi:selenocysteine lyase/cysteine desulfurase
MAARTTGLDRRQVMAAALALGSTAAARAAMPAPAGDVARDSAYWAAYGDLFDRPQGVIQLEHGYFGAVAAPVRAALARWQERVNRDTAWYARGAYSDDLAVVRAQAAAVLGVAPDEIAFSRNASESMQVLIGGYHRLAPGDSVLISDLDYYAMQDAMRWLADRRGVKVVQIAIPEPASVEAILATYQRAFADTPRLKLALLTHVTHRTGLVMPVAEIGAMARRAGIDTMVDAAQSWGLSDMTLPAMDSDFVGLNGHKWIGAPVGVGIVYIKRDRMDAIAPFMGAAETPQMPIESRLHPGTISFATWLTLGDALTMHQSVGTPAKAARQRYLRNAWVQPLLGDPRIAILTPEDPRLFAGSTSFRLKVRTTMVDNVAIAQRLLKDHGIMTVAREGAARGACVRVTPAPFSTEADLAALVTAIRAIAG